MNRDEFFAAPSDTQPKTLDVLLPDGRTVKVRKLSQAEVEHMSKHYSTPAKSAEGLRYIVVRAMVDDQGERILKDDDIAKLAEKDFDIVKAIASAASEFSGLKVPNESAA